MIHLHEVSNVLAEALSLLYEHAMFELKFAYAKLSSSAYVSRGTWVA